jgi:hypothetical protein
MSNGAGGGDMRAALSLLAARKPISTPRPDSQGCGWGTVPCRSFPEHRHRSGRCLATGMGNVCFLFAWFCLWLYVRKIPGRFSGVDFETSGFWDWNENGSSGRGAWAFSFINSFINPHSLLWKESVALAAFHSLPPQKNKLVGSRVYVNWVQPKMS